MEADRTRYFSVDPPFVHAFLGLDSGMTRVDRLGKTKIPPSARRKRELSRLLNSAYLPRANVMNPSRFGIATFGSDCAFMVSPSAMMPLRLSK